MLHHALCSQTYDIYKYPFGVPLVFIFLKTGFKFHAYCLLVDKLNETRNIFNPLKLSEFSYSYHGGQSISVLRGFFFHFYSISIEQSVIK